MTTTNLLFGLDRLEKGEISTHHWGRCGLVCNQASLTVNLKPAWKTLADRLQGDSKLSALFGPQHGFASTVQENMLETGHSRHTPSGVPVFSLYSETREPTVDMLKNVDTLVVDLAITGCRIYTYKYTLAACLRAAKKHGKKVVVLDRPNPLGGEFVEGNVLELNATSFVGEFPIPMRHGLTMGEAALFFNRTIGATLEVVELTGWDPRKLWTDYGRPWVITSPNMSCIESCYVFPGMVLFEGTNVSEGRGTTLPFLFMGAPYIKDADALIKRIRHYMPDLKGVHLQETAFMPAYSKWKDQECQGFLIHVLDARALQSTYFGLATLRAFMDLGETNFAWRDPPYEYNYELLPIEVLMGRRGVHKQLAEAGFKVEDAIWRTGLSEYVKAVDKFLLYKRKMVVV